MDAVSLSFSSQVLEFFSFSSRYSSQGPETPPTLSGTESAPQLPAPDTGAPAAQEQAPSSPPLVLQNSQTAAFLDLHVQIQLAEQEQTRHRGHELRHETRHLLKQLSHDVRHELKGIREQVAGPGEEGRDEIKDLGKEFKKALKEAFKGMFGDRHRAERAPLLMGPGDLLSAVRSAVDDLLSGLRDILPGNGAPAGEGGSPKATDASAATEGTAPSPGQSTTEVPATTTSGADADPAEAVGNTVEEEAESTQLPAAANDLLQALTDMLEKFVSQLRNVFADNPFPVSNPGQSTTTANFNLTFTYFAQTSFEFSAGSTGEAVNTVA